MVCIYAEDTAVLWHRITALFMKKIVRVGKEIKLKLQPYLLSSDTWASEAILHKTWSLFWFLSKSVDKKLIDILLFKKRNLG